MRAQNRIIFILQKTRNSDGLGTQVHLKWEPKYLRIVNEDDNSQSKPLQVNLKQKAGSDDESNNLLSDEAPSAEAGGNKLMDMLTNCTL